MATTDAPILPGRLGSPDMVLRDDPRADPRMIAVIDPIGMAGAPEPLPIDDTASIEALLAYCAESEAGFEELNKMLMDGLPPVAGVQRSTEIIRGVDNNDITLFIHRPVGSNGVLPGILHLHGGGMVLLEAAGAGYMRWRDELAASGLVVVGVEFRNGGGKQGPHPFPAGLNDCSAALQWMSSNRSALGVSKIVVSGESGGGNLTLATVLQAKRDGRLDQVAGAYAQCPYISNAYGARDPRLPSLFENDGYLLTCSQMATLSRIYDPERKHVTDPLAWPLHAGLDELRGLPPHVISVNELDPLRDEGLTYFRKLLAAGVNAVGRTVNGTCHAGDCLFRAAMPDVYLATIRDIKGFADSL